MLRKITRILRERHSAKHDHEIDYWRKVRPAEGRFPNHWYRSYMENMAGTANFSGKLVADFGCGPRGSLAWVDAKAAIGIDVLASRYAEEFPDDIKSHGMIYVTSTETVIPIASDSIDILFTMNALDHVKNLDAMCDEMCRILKPGGLFCASFNLNEPPTPEEPQQLTEALLQNALLHRFDEQDRRFGRAVDPANHYSEMFGGGSTYRDGEEGYMWFRGTLA